MKNKSILVTGGASFIGSNFANILAEGNEVVALDNSYLGTPENLNDNVEFVEASVLADLPTEVDIVIEHDCGLLLEKRKNEPVKGEWFVPGGTVLKNEPRTEAVCRVADKELGEPVVIDERLGTYEHFYNTSEIEGVDLKHYVATVYHCHFESDGPIIT